MIPISEQIRIKLKKIIDIISLNQFEFPVSEDSFN